MSHDSVPSIEFVETLKFKTTFNKKKLYLPIRYLLILEKYI